jgi:hypothetical protein
VPVSARAISAEVGDCIVSLILLRAVTMREAGVKEVVDDADVNGGDNTLSPKEASFCGMSLVSGAPGSMFTASAASIRTWAQIESRKCEQKAED